MLHVSLLELAEQAPRCTDAATLRGVLAEAADLARNAADHSSDATDIAGWYSTLLRDAFRSPATHDLLHGADLVLTGPAGRDDALPGSPLTWLTVIQSPSPPDHRPLLEVLHSVGVIVVYSPWPAFTQDQWSDRIREAAAHRDSAALGWLYDAGGWFGQAVVDTASKSTMALLQDAVLQRPPALQVAGGLPARNIEVDVARHLLHPLTRITRWAGLAAGYPGAHTRQRLEHARQAGVLTLEETTLLAEAWRAGHALRMHRWLDSLGQRTVRLADMDPVQRSTFGASCRAVADVTRAIASRHNIALATA
ncbi:MAG: putative nucleotidyltransferase substrate binding domain-containing protein [Corynebacterium sp.]|nr:putative nucleotidyltransferase substrate binding domain-containing protein [Corynebacterium sp.]